MIEHGYFSFELANTRAMIWDLYKSSRFPLDIEQALETQVADAIVRLRVRIALRGRGAMMLVGCGTILHSFCALLYEKYMASYRVLKRV